MPWRSSWRWQAWGVSTQALLRPPTSCVRSWSTPTARRRRGAASRWSVGTGGRGSVSIQRHPLSRARAIWQPRRTIVQPSGSIGHVTTGTTRLLATYLSGADGRPDGARCDPGKRTAVRFAVFAAPLLLLASCGNALPGPDGYHVPCSESEACEGEFTCLGWHGPYGSEGEGDTDLDLVCSMSCSTSLDGPRVRSTRCGGLARCVANVCGYAMCY